MFKLNEQIDIFESVKKIPRGVSESNGVLEVMNLRTKGTWLLKIKNINLLIHEQKYDSTYFITDGIIAAGANLEQMKYISKEYGIELFECYDFLTMRGTCLDENGSVVLELKEFREALKQREN